MTARLSLLLAATQCFAAEPGQIRTAAARSITLIQKVNAQWKNPCFSCHNQTLGDQALESARRHGIAVDEKLALASSTRTYKRLTDLDGAVRIDELIDPASSEGAMLLGANAAGVKRTLVTATYARHVLRNQMPDGHWDTFDSRPPEGASIISATAVASRAVDLYLPEGVAKRASIDRARQWLMTAKVLDTEDSAYRLIGLHWVGAAQGEIAVAAKHLASLQRADGSWHQTPASKQSDAYATAESLYALALSKTWNASSPRYQLGLDWLLKHQAADGSWHVSSRLHTPAPISPPYFESGFPYGHDQFISSAATALAVMAMLENLPAVGSPTQPQSLASFDDSRYPWAGKALFGTPADMATIDPNAATADGTTALMMAADDPAKVEVLLKHGAKPKAITKAGLDAMMIASLFKGNARTLDLLLRAGASHTPSHKVRFDAHPLAHAVMTNDPSLVEFLVSKGAPANRPMRLLGGGPVMPIHIAAGFGNPAILSILVKAGVKVDEPDSTGMTALSMAALGFRPEAVKTLLGLGANPRHKDSFGLTPYEHTQGISETPVEAAMLLKGR